MKSEEKRESGLRLQPEARLFEQAQGGCWDSLDLLMRRHEPLVRYAVRRQNLGDLPWEEAEQAGRIVLWKAILGFNAHRGATGFRATPTLRLCIRFGRTSRCIVLPTSERMPLESG